MVYQIYRYRSCYSIEKEETKEEEEEDEEEKREILFR